jgi:CRP/FNR family transcriptional regulator, cyclic AMP receptor protein
MDLKARVRQWRIRKNRTACILDDLDLFSECTVKQLRSVAQLICPISVTRDRVIVHAGDRCDQLVVVLSGEARTSTPDGRESFVGPGSLLGEQALLPESVEIATVTATTTMELLVASQSELSAMIWIAPSIERKLMERVLHELPAQQPEVVAAEHPSRARVAFTG